MTWSRVRGQLVTHLSEASPSHLLLYPRARQLYAGLIPIHSEFRKQKAEPLGSADQGNDLGGGIELKLTHVGLADYLQLYRLGLKVFS